MRTGTLRDPITIERRSVTGQTSGLNTDDKAWGTLKSILSRAQARPGKEFIENAQRYNETVVWFTCHKVEVDDVAETDRVVFDGRVHEIKSIVPDHEYRDRTIIRTSRAA